MIVRRLLPSQELMKIFVFSLPTAILRDIWFLKKTIFRKYVVIFGV